MLLQTQKLHHKHNKRLSLDSPLKLKPCFVAQLCFVVSRVSDQNGYPKENITFKRIIFIAFPFIWLNNLKWVVCSQIFFVYAAHFSASWNLLPLTATSLTPPNSHLILISVRHIAIQHHDVMYIPEHSWQLQQPTLHFVQQRIWEDMPQGTWKTLTIHTAVTSRNTLSLHRSHRILPVRGENNIHITCSFHVQNTEHLNTSINIKI